jgi:hypothetical protein
LLRVKPDLDDRLLCAVELIGVVVDQEVRQQTEAVRDDAGVLAENPDAEGMESTHHEPGGGALANQAFDPVAHLAGGLVGKGDREDLVGQDAAFLDQVGDAMGQDTGLTGARSGDDKNRPIDRLDGEALVGVESVKQFGGLVDHLGVLQGSRGLL